MPAPAMTQNTCCSVAENALISGPNNAGPDARALSVSASCPVAPLRDDNWQAWRLRMKCHLQVLKVFKYAEGKCPKPHPREGTASCPHTVAWEAEDLIAQAMIVTNIEDQQIYHLYEAQSAAQMWEKLHLAHKPRGIYASVVAYGELLSAKCPEGENVVAHINKLKRMRYNLASMGEPVDDNKFKRILLMNMPVSRDVSALFPWIARAGAEDEPVVVEELIIIHTDMCRHLADDSSAQDETMRKRKAPVGLMKTQVASKKRK